jgi:N-acyl homoserine lactone hydrolase
VTEIVRLHLAWLRIGERDWPVHGFVLTHPQGAILVDTGVGAPDQVLNDFRAVNRSVADALTELDLSPADISRVINTHLHFDHCGQNSVFPHVPIYVQRRELDRARAEQAELADWFDFAGAKFELLDGDAEIVSGVRVIATPGHTVGHQCVVVDTRRGCETLIGDAAYTSDIFAHPGRFPLPAGQAADHDAWLQSLARVRALQPQRVHFCHDPIVTVGGVPGASGSIPPT